MKNILIATAFLTLLFFSNCANNSGEDPSAQIIITIDAFSATIDENPAAGDILGVVSANAARGEIAFSIANQTPSGAVAIDATTGELSVADATLFDFETSPSISGVINAQVEQSLETGIFTITINNVAEEGEGLVINDFETTVQENTASGTIIGAVSASGSDNFTYELVSQSPEGAVSIDQSTGAISIDNAAVFDFEINKEITGTISVADGTNSATANFTITITNEVEDGEFNIWTGSTVTFTKSNNADPAQQANQDRLTDNVWLTRGNSGGQIYNARTESSDDKNSSPADTEWAVGTTAELGQLTFAPFRTTVRPKNAVGQNLVLHLITDDIYIDIRFTSWTSGRGSGGGFSYQRSSE